MRHDELEAHYRGLEARYSVSWCDSYGTLVTANGNATAPIHRWFRMKEAFSNRLLSKVITDAGLSTVSDLQLLDPFSGSGTTGVSAGDLVRETQLASARVTALEVNPFLHMLSLAKMLGHTTPDRGIEKFAGEVARRAMSRVDGVSPLPELSTFANPAYFEPSNLEDLLAIKASVDRFAARDNQSDNSLFLSVALAAAIEPASNLRRDGRALRLHPGKLKIRPIDVFLRASSAIAEDLTARSIAFQSDVLLTDSRQANSAEFGEHDLALFSPPYPNNIDYTEVYKLEGWLLGLYENQHDFAFQRRRSLRSHNSLRWGDSYTFHDSALQSEFEALLSPITAAIPDDRYKQGRREVVLGYADDMFQTMRSTHAALKPGGVMAVVVGNSMHGKPGKDFVIASDLILAKLAELAGFTVDHIVVARYPRRRTARSAYLRESIVFARKDA